MGVRSALENEQRSLSELCFDTERAEEQSRHVVEGRETGSDVTHCHLLNDKGMSWARHMTNFDISIPDTTVPSYRGADGGFQ